MKFSLGDVVGYHLRDHGCGPGAGTVIGYTFPDVCVVADERAHGMPIHESHCSLGGRNGEHGYAAAARWRERYESLYGALLPMTPNGPEGGQ